MRQYIGCEIIGILTKNYPELLVKRKAWVCITLFLNLSKISLHGFGNRVNHNCCHKNKFWKTLPLLFFLLSTSLAWLAFGRHVLCFLCSMLTTLHLETTHHILGMFPCRDWASGGRQHAIGLDLDLVSLTGAQWAWSVVTLIDTMSIRTLPHGRDGSLQLISQLISQLMSLTPLWGDSHSPAQNKQKRWSLVFQQIQCSLESLPFCADFMHFEFCKRMFYLTHSLITSCLHAYLYAANSKIFQQCECSLFLSGLLIALQLYFLQSFLHYRFDQIVPSSFLFF